MNRISITRLDDPRLDLFRDMKSTNSRRRKDIFVAEGTTLVERLLLSSYEVIAVLGSEQKLGNFAARIPDGTLVYEVTRELATELVGYQFHLGVIAAARAKSPPALQDVFADRPDLVFLADHVIDPQNVGLLIRIASAFGAGVVIFGQGSADAFSRRALRVSTGNGLYLPIIEQADTASILQKLQQWGYHICGTILDETAIPLESFAFPKRSVVVFGNESHGISDSIADRCDSQLTISMLNDTDSLNVAVAAGIFGYAYRSQHRSLPEISS